MFPNPKPAVDAVGKTGPLPGFLFSNPIIAGFFAMIMLPVFGAAAVVFFAQVGTRADEAFEVARGGAIVAVLIGVVVYGAIFISAIFLPEERTTRLQFVFGGALGLGALVALDVFAADYIRAFLAGNGFEFPG